MEGLAFEGDWLRPDSIFLDENILTPLFSGIEKELFPFEGDWLRRDSTYLRESSCLGEITLELRIVAVIEFLNE